MAKSMVLGDFKRNNLFVTVLILFCVIALLFLPDIFGFNTGPSIGKETELGFNIAKIWEDTTSSDNEASISYIENQGEIATEEGSAAENENYAVQNVSVENGLGQNDGNITWASIKGRPSKRLLLSIKGKVNTLADRLALELESSRFALYNYAAGIDFILDSGSSRISASEAVLYLERLDMAVTKALHDEGAGREDLRLWSKISLTPVVHSSVADQYKQSVRPAFKPDIVFRELTLQRYDGSRNPLGLTKKEYAVWISAYFQGRDVRSVEVLHNGNFVRRLIARPINSGRGGWFQIDTPRLKSGLISFVFRSKEGKRNVVHYKFYGNENQLPWRDNSLGGKIVKFQYRGIERARMLEAKFRFQQESNNSVGNLISVSNGRGNLFVNVVQQPYSIF